MRFSLPIRKNLPVLHYIGFQLTDPLEKKNIGLRETVLRLAIGIGNERVKQHLCANIIDAGYLLIIPYFHPYSIFFIFFINSKVRIY